MDDPILDKVLDLLVVSARAAIHEHPVRLRLQLVVIGRIEHCDDLGDTVAVDHRIDLGVMFARSRHQLRAPGDDVGNRPQGFFQDGHGLLLEETAQILDHAAVHRILRITPSSLSHLRVVKILPVVALQRDHAADHVKRLRNDVNHVMSQERDDVGDHAGGHQVLCNEVNEKNIRSHGRQSQSGVRSPCRCG